MMILTLALAAASFDETPPNFRKHVLTLSPPPREIVVEDLNGDGLADLGASYANSMALYFQRPGQGLHQEPDQILRFEERALGWDIADLDGDGRADLVLMGGGQTVHVYDLVAERKLEKRETPLVRRAGGFLPDGFRHVAFIRDLDGDGDGDVVIPSRDRCRLFLRQEDGTYDKGPEIAVDVQINLGLWGGEELNSEIYQDIRVPFFRIEDVNGDGHPDLISATREKLGYYLADGNKGLPFRATFELDIEALEKTLNRDEDDIDFSNLFAPATNRVETRAKDMNGDGRLDFVVRVGQKIRLYLGKENGVDFESRPDDIKKISGNIVTHFLHDDDQDGLLDLHIVRVETISIGDVLPWLFLSGSLKLDLFIYRNENRQRLPKRPTRKWTLSLDFPPLLEFADRASDMSDNLREQADVAAVAADLDGDGKRDDVALLLEDATALHGFRDRVPDGWRETPSPADFFRGIKRQIGYSEGEEDYSLDLEKFDEWIPLPAHELKLSVEGESPYVVESYEVPPDAEERADILSLDLNADGRDDVLVAARDDLAPGTLVLTVFLSQGS